MNNRKQMMMFAVLLLLGGVITPGQLNPSEDLFVVIVNDKRGFIDRTGRVVIEPRWAGANNFSEGLAVVATYEGGYKEGYIDQAGKVVIEPAYVMARDFSEGLAAVGFGEYGLHNSGDHKTGFIDQTGKLVIEPKYRDALSFSEGLAVVCNDNKCGYIDKTGKLAIPIQFDDAKSFSEGLACVQIGEKFGFIDKAGNVVIKPTYSLPATFKEGLASVVTGGKGWQGHGGFVFTEKGEPAFIDKTGQIAIRLGNDIEGAASFSEGLAAVDVKSKNNRDTLTGFIDRTGKFVIAPKYSDVDSFSDGLAQFRLDGEWAYLNKQGEIALKTKFSQARDFVKGLAWVQEGHMNLKTFKGEKYGYIDKTGKVIWKPTR